MTKHKYFYTADMIKQGEDHFFITTSDKKMLDDTLNSLEKEIKDLKVKMFYVKPAEKKETVEEVQSGETSKLYIDKGNVVKAMRVSNVPSGAVKWQNKFSTFFAVDEAGKNAGNSNPAYQQIKPEARFPHMGNLDPMLGMQTLDSIDDLYSILCNFDMDIANAKELEDIKKYFPNASYINRVMHNITLFDAEGRELTTLRINMYPNN